VALKEAQRPDAQTLWVQNIFRFVSTITEERNFDVCVFKCTRKPVTLWYGIGVSKFVVLRSPHVGGLSSHAPLGTATLCEGISRLVSRYSFRPSTHFFGSFGSASSFQRAAFRRPDFFNLDNVTPNTNEDGNQPIYSISSFQCGLGRS